MDEQQECTLRRKAIRLSLKGWAPSQILAVIPRSRQWLWKWWQRFRAGLGTGLHSRSRRPKRAPAAYAAAVRQVVVRVRRRLKRAKVGLIGAATIQRELRRMKVLRVLPSTSTIQRILHRAGLTQPPAPPQPAYYPPGVPPAPYVLYATDWTERYLAGGAKLYAFHTLDLETRACQHSLSTNKSGATVRTHSLATWERLGIPDFLRLDNDAAFNGGYKVPRVIGQFVRLCLYVGIELIFIPVGQAERNGEVESLNGLWGRAGYDRQRFRSVAAALRSEPVFQAWYMQVYAPPSLHGQTPAQAQAQVQRRCLTAREGADLPGPLPITAGRIHFIRQVDAAGTIALLNEAWRVGVRYAGRYVWATINTQARRLTLYYRATANRPVRVLRQFPYPLGETVLPLPTHFQRPYPRCRVSTML
jgi:hypothetical protein